MLGREAKTRREIENDIRSFLSAMDLLLKTGLDISKVGLMLDDILKALESV
jgi:hypothetical protein